MADNILILDNIDDDITDINDINEYWIRKKIKLNNSRSSNSSYEYDDDYDHDYKHDHDHKDDLDHNTLINMIIEEFPTINIDHIKSLILKNDDNDDNNNDMILDNMINIMKTLPYPKYNYESSLNIMKKCRSMQEIKIHDKIKQYKDIDFIQECLKFNPNISCQTNLTNQLIMQNLVNNFNEDKNQQSIIENAEESSKGQEPLDENINLEYDFNDDNFFTLSELNGTRFNMTMMMDSIPAPIIPFLDTTKELIDINSQKENKAPDKSFASGKSMETKNSIKNTKTKLSDVNNLQESTNLTIIKDYETNILNNSNKLSDQRDKDNDKDISLPLEKAKFNNDNQNDSLGKKSIICHANISNNISNNNDNDINNNVNPKKIIYYNNYYKTDNILVDPEYTLDHDEYLIYNYDNNRDILKEINHNNYENISSCLYYYHDMS